MTNQMTTRTRSSRPPAALGRGTLWSVALGVAALGAAALPGASHAQPRLDQPSAPAAVDQRWLPWLGCWQLVEETVPLPELAGDLPPSFADRVLVCVTPPAGPAPSTDVTVTTLADGERVLMETLSADGVEHPIDQTECSGRRRIAWSDDGARLYTRAGLTCGGEDVRRLSGVGLIADNWNWLDLELVEAGQRAAVSVRRYRRAGDVATLGAAGPTLTADLLAQARTAAIRSAAADLTVDAVIEAGAELEPAVIEALLVETDTMFDLDARTLIRLDDGGVPTEVIDLLVALSFPDDFSVQRSGAPVTSYGGGGAGAFLDTSWGGYGYNTWFPYYVSPFGYYYGWSPYDSLYGYGRYGWSPIDSYYIGGPTFGPSGFIGTESGRPSEGRVYEGYGYTRVGTSGGDSGRRAQPRGTSSAGGRSSGGGSSGGATVSSGGYSSGGGSSGGATVSSGGASSSGGGGRTATPRDQ